MKGISAFFSLCVVCYCFRTVQCIPSDYLNEICDSSVSVAQSRRLESSTALFYPPQLSCYYTVTVPAGKRVMLIVRLFDLESEVNGACVDYVNVHDGSSTSAATLNASPLCAEDAEGNFTATGNTMTIYFHTDSTGARHGFDFIFVAITTGVCNSDQFACNSSICIHKDLQCTIFDECGDASDEDGCTYETPTGVQLHDDAALIIGLTIGLFVAIIIGAVVGYFCYRHHIRWRMFMKRPFSVEEVVHEETSYGSAYPVTKIYYKDKYQDMYQQARKPPMYFDNRGVSCSKNHNDTTAGSQTSSEIAISGEKVSTSTRKDSI